MKREQEINLFNDPEFLFQEFLKTKQELFNARSVKKVKFLQRKLEYLQKMVKEEKVK
jgi:hypothetical protein